MYNFWGKGPHIEYTFDVECPIPHQRYEIKRGLLAKNTRANREKLRIFEEFCREYRIMFLDNQEIFDRASEVYAKLNQEGQLIEDADILIAAIAMTRNLVLVSHDSDFDRIDDITIEDWLET